MARYHQEALSGRVSPSFSPWNKILSLIRTAWVPSDPRPDNRLPARPAAVVRLAVVAPPGLDRNGAVPVHHLDRRRRAPVVRTRDATGKRELGRPVRQLRRRRRARVREPLARTRAVVLERDPARGGESFLVLEDQPGRTESTNLSEVAHRTADPPTIAHVGVRLVRLTHLPRRVLPRLAPDELLAAHRPDFQHQPSLLESALRPPVVRRHERNRDRPRLLQSLAARP